jgi:HNH endonuclease
MMSIDELVLQAITRDHSASFDRLALFALNLSRVGRGAPEARPALWANEFVRESLWQDGGWRTTALVKPTMDVFFEDRIEAQPAVRRKVRSNYRHLYELCDYLPSRTPVINSDPSTWGVAALFLAWDRLTLDGDLAAAANPAALARAATTEELHKLLGVTQDEGAQLSRDAADLYISAGRLARTAANVAAIAVVAQTQTDVAVERKTRMLAQQVRDPSIARKLKATYGNRCTFCDQALQIATDPVRYFSNAAHIKPLGSPHDGPDREGNILILCPNHHVQFDEGILRLARVGNQFEIQSKIADDPLHGRRLTLGAGHALDATLVLWHFNFHHETAQR